LGIEEKHIQSGHWQDASGKLKVQIVTAISGVTPPREAPPPEPAPTIDLQTIDEPPRHHSLATTALEEMRRLFADRPKEWWLPYRLQLLPHVNVPPDNLAQAMQPNKTENIGTAVGTLVHRLMEMGKNALDLPDAELTKLLTAMACNHLSVGTTE